MIERFFTVWTDPATGKETETEILPSVAEYMQYKDSGTLTLKTQRRKHVDPDRVPPMPATWAGTMDSWAEAWHKNQVVMVGRQYQDDGVTLISILIWLFLLLSMLVPAWGMPVAFAAVAVQNTASEYSGIDSVSHSSLTISVTVNAGSDLCLITGHGFGAATAQVISGVTFNADAMTNVDTQYTTNGVRGEMWKLVNPDVVTGNLVTTYDAAVLRSLAGATIFTGVHQTTPTGTPAKGGCE